MAGLPGQQLLAPARLAGRLLSSRPSVADAALVLIAFAVDFISLDYPPALTTGRSVPLYAILLMTLPFFVLLLVRDQWPFGVFILTWLYSVGAGIIIRGYEPFTGLLLCLYRIARRESLSSSLVVLLSAIGPLGLNAYKAGQASHNKALGSMVAALIWAVIVGIVWSAARSGQRADRTAQLRDQARAAEAALAVAEERLRLARELHDIVAHTVTSIVFQAAGARRALGSDSVGVTLGRIEQAGTQALRELRQLLGLLHSAPDAADAIPARLTTLDRVQDLVATTRAAGVEVEFVERGERRRLDPGLDHIAYRAIQELLANAMKHGDSRGRTEVELTWTDASLRIKVSNAVLYTGSHSIITAYSGYGLAGLRDRVASAGGSFEAAQRGAIFEVALELQTR
jgi:signal transduction histidine kinase